MLKPCTEGIRLRPDLALCNVIRSLTLLAAHELGALSVLGTGSKERKIQLVWFGLTECYADQSNCLLNPPCTRDQAVLPNGTCFHIS
jgi:hypothetical protein